MKSENMTRWRYGILILLVQAVGAYLYFRLDHFRGNPDEISIIGLVPLLAGVGAVLFGNFWVIAQRFKYLGHSRWWCLLGLLGPIWGSIVLIWLFFAKPSEPE